MNKWAGKIRTTSQMSNNNFRKKIIIRKATHDDTIVISDSNKNHVETELAPISTAGTELSW